MKRFILAIIALLILAGCSGNTLKKEEIENMKAEYLLSLQ